MSRLWRARDKLGEAIEEATEDAALVASTMAGLETWAREVRDIIGSR